MFKLKHESLIDSNSGLNRKKTKSLTPLDDEDINNNTNCNNTGEVSKKTAPVVKKNSRQFLSIIDNFLSKTKHGNVNNKQNYRQQQQLLGSASKCELIELDSLTSGDGVNGPSLAHAETTSSSTNSIDKLYKTESKSLGDFKVRLKNSPKVIYKTTVNKLTKGWQYAAAAGKSAVAKSDEIESIKMKESTSNDTGLVRPRCGSLFEAVDFTPQEVSLFETNRLDELENLSVLNSLLNSYRNRRADSFDGVSVGENFDQPEEYNSANGSYKNLVHFGIDTPGEETFLEHSDCEGNDDDDHKIPNLNELPYGWTCDRTSDGKIYYLNHITQTTQWTHPNLENHQNSFQPSPFSTDCKYASLLSFIHL